MDQIYLITTQGSYESNETVLISYSATILGLTGLSCVLSIFGACVILVAFWLMPEIRNFTRKLIVSLTIADLMSAVGYLLSVLRYTIDHHKNYKYNKTSDEICTVQSILTTFSSIVSFYFTIMISLHLMVTVIQPGYQRNSNHWLAGFNTIGWTIPAIITIAAAADDVLGQDSTNIGATGPWCWVKPKHETKYIVWMFMAGKGWEISCYLLSTMLYMCMKYYHYRRNRHIHFQTLDDDLREDDKNFLYVFFVLYVIRLWGTIRFFMIITRATGSKTESSFMSVFLYMQALGDPAQAFCNFLLFCVFDREVRKKMFERVCCRRERHEDNAGETRALLNPICHNTSI